MTTRAFSSCSERVRGESMSVDTSAAAVEVIARGYDYGHGPVADLLRELVTERDEAIRQRDFQQKRADTRTAAYESLCVKLEAAEAMASTLEDAAFHFQTCRTCADDGEDACESGRQFAAFLRGEEIPDAN